MSDSHTDKVDEAKRRLRRAIKLFHNADEHWGSEMIAEFEDGAPKDMTLLEWIDAGIESCAAPSAVALGTACSGDVRFNPSHEGASAEDVFDWLDKNTTHYIVDSDGPTEGTNIPTLAKVSARIFYHATDDMQNDLLSSIVREALKAPQSAKRRTEDPCTEGLYRLAKECGWSETSSRPPELFIRDRLATPSASADLARLPADQFARTLKVNSIIEAAWARDEKRLALALMSEPATAAEIAGSTELPAVKAALSAERGHVNQPFERVPQHAADPGFGPVPPAPAVAEINQRAARPMSVVSPSQGQAEEVAGPDTPSATAAHQFTDSSVLAQEIADALDVAECAIHDKVSDPNEREWLYGILKKLRAGALESTQSETSPTEPPALEPAQCAYVNLNNMVKMMPALARHPLLPMVKAQLRASIEHLGGKDFCDMEDGNG